MMKVSENNKHLGNAQCPQCVTEGHDNNGDNLGAVPTVFIVFDLYLVFDTGLVISFKRKNPIIIKTFESSNGYLTLSINKKRTLHHRFIWEVFNGSIPAGLQINHKDGNKKNNNLSNLELVTQSKNMKHAYSIGLQSPKKKLNKSERKKIQQSQKSQRHLAKEYNVSQCLIWKIKNDV